MSDEKHPRHTRLDAEPETGPTPPPSSPGKKQRSVFVYLAILFIAAFLLLLFAYLMQQRNSREILGNLSDLRDSMTSFQSLDDLMEENRTLREENEALQQQIEEQKQELQQLEEINQSFQTSIDGLTDTLAHQEMTAEWTGQAMDLFWQIDEAYVLRRFPLCRELIEQMESTENGSPLKDYLPTESTTGNDRYSPAQRYQEIADALE